MKVALVFLCALLGFAAALPNGRIVGGSSAGAGQFPYMVSLRNQQGAHFCGGFIYNTRWIVSAAHCTFGRMIVNVISHVGTNSISNGGIAYTTSSISNHPNFNANTLLNDISLVWTSTAIVRSASVAPIALGTANIGAGVYGVVTGWGLTGNPGYAPDLLQWLQKPTMSNTSCRLAHSLGNRGRIENSNICTDNLAGVGNCSGDNGGPLVAGAAVIGIFSWSVPCGQGVPDIYTRTSSYVTWVQGIAGNSGA